MRGEAFLSVRGLCKAYSHTRWPARRTEILALRDVTIEIRRGQTLGVVGPSGSGKSTLARCLALREKPTAGEIRLDGRDLSRLSRRERRKLRAEVQLIPQQPASTLNPRFTAEETISEPLEIQGGHSRHERRARVIELMELTGISAAMIGRRALEFSGGERQRLAIARALALDPKLLILDESLTGLDLSVQAQIVTLLLDLQKRNGLTYILISHDLSVAGNIADELAVMDGGALVERGDAAEVIARPQHPRTRELVDAAAALAMGSGA
jgi:ABC-type glutathione transport system ATPase component